MISLTYNLPLLQQSHLFPYLSEEEVTDILLRHELNFPAAVEEVLAKQNKKEQQKTSSTPTKSSSKPITSKDSFSELFGIPSPQNNSKGSNSGSTPSSTNTSIVSDLADLFGSPPVPSTVTSPQKSTPSTPQNFDPFADLPGDNQTAAPADKDKKAKKEKKEKKATHTEEPPHDDSAAKDDKKKKEKSDKEEEKRKKHVCHFWLV